MNQLLSINSLKAWYTEDKPVLKGMNIDLEENSVIGLIGLNGAGKTTLMNVICGLHPGYETSGIKLKGENRLNHIHCGGDVTIADAGDGDGTLIACEVGVRP